MTFFITGGCGFLGSNLAGEVLRRGDELVVYDSLTRVGSDRNLAWLRSLGDFRFLKADVRDATRLDDAIDEVRPDVVFHLAGQVAMTTSLADPRADFEINAGGTLNVLEAIRRHVPDALVTFSSTNKVYGDLEWTEYVATDSRWTAPDYPHGFPEDIPLTFHSPYGCSKGAADQYMLDYARMYGLKTVVFRHSSMYGGRQFSTADQGWVGWFCGRALRQADAPNAEPFTISGDGKQVRDLLHAEDMISLYFSAVEHADAAAGEAFNIGGGMPQSLSLLELFAELETLLDADLRFEKLPARASDQRVFVADVAKAERRLGWRPRVDLTTGLSSMIDWVRSSRAA